MATGAATLLHPKMHTPDGARAIVLDHQVPQTINLRAALGAKASDKIEVLPDSPTEPHLLPRAFPTVDALVQRFVEQKFGGAFDFQTPKRPHENFESLRVRAGIIDPEKGELTINPPRGEGNFVSYKLRITPADRSEKPKEMFLTFVSPETREAFNAWAAAEQQRGTAWTLRLPKPCDSVEVVGGKPRFNQKAGCEPSQWEAPAVSGAMAADYYHVGSAFEARSKPVVLENGERVGHQAMYDSAGRFITDPQQGAGTADRGHPGMTLRDPLSHLRKDVVPFAYAMLLDGYPFAQVMGMPLGGSIDWRGKLGPHTEEYLKHRPAVPSHHQSGSGTR